MYLKDNGMKQLTALLFTVALGLSARDVHIASIEVQIVGQQSASAALVKASLTLRKGQPLSAVGLQAAAKTLKDLSVFEEVQAQTAREKSGGFAVAILITGKETADTPAALLHRLLCAMGNKDFDTVNDCLMPMKRGNLDLRGMIVEELKSGRKESSKGDYAYSDRAMIEVIRKYGNAFTEMEGFWKGQLEELREALPELAALDIANYRMLHKGKLGIVIAKYKGEWKMVGWENLNIVLETQ
ncbi:MAG: hypothetical protein ACI8W8_001071 [Rhodothermales bacterium]|jgi:hypothetical protein